LVQHLISNDKLFVDYATYLIIWILSQQDIENIFEKE